MRGEGEGESALGEAEVGGGAVGRGKAGSKTYSRVNKEYAEGRRAVSRWEGSRLFSIREGTTCARKGFGVLHSE